MFKLSFNATTLVLCWVGTPRGYVFAARPSSVSLRTVFQFRAVFVTPIHGSNFSAILHVPKPFVYIEKPRTLVDTTIAPEIGHYYRFSKDEQYKAITMEVSTNLMTGWKDVTNFSLAKLKGYEGPECYQIKPAANGKPATWCLILDQYSKGTGYQPFVTEDLSSGRFNPGEGFVFPFRLRHGSPLPISAAEPERLEKAYGATRTSNRSRVPP